jgi:phosphotransferase system enzyme I (PtsP)
LDQATRIIVRQVREAMGVAACSVYLMDEASHQYVLMATEGLAQDAVGRFRVPRDEGLVGLVGERQEPLNLANARKHPRYRRASESGEDCFCAFLGVPIIHRGQVLGVLVVQRREEADFAEDETAFLVTVAAQLAGVINHAAMDGSVRRLLGGELQERPFLQGVPGASGIAVGTITVVVPLAKLESVPDRVIADVAAEETRFRSAVSRVQDELRSGGTRLTAALPAEEQVLFDAYVMLAGSDSLISGVIRRIQGGNWAAAALRDTITEHAFVFEQMEDPYLRSRAEDIRAIGRHILARLESDAETSRAYPQHCVLVGADVSAMEIAKVPVQQLAGIVCTGGSALSHTAILARALGIPAVMGLGDLSLTPLEGREVVMDGYQGRVYIQPSAAVRAEYQRLATEEMALAQGLEGLRDQPAETPDGARLALYVNSGLLADMPMALDSGAEGVGLYRTEFAFMIRDSFPGEEEQYRIYRKALMLLAPKPVTMRTLDVGGDKPLPYFTMTEANPFLGWRGIRIVMDHPEILLTQLRAMLRANAGLNNLRILLPMISKVGEVDKAIGLLDQARWELREADQPAPRPLLGIMVETPAVLYQIPALVRRVDFLSIGTNDLTQYLLAVDRNNARVAGLYDNLHPAVLQAVHQVVKEAHQWGKPISVCGEMAGDAAAVILLVGMGVETLSVARPELLRIKRVIRAIPRTQARHLLDQALHMEDASEVRGLLTNALDQVGLGGLVRVGH